MKTKPARQTVTISGLFAQDVPNGYLFPEYPSSFQKNAASFNDEKYFIHDFPAPPVMYLDYLRPIRVCPVLGNDIPILLRREPSIPLQTHWRKWVPDYQEPDIRVYSKENTGDAPLIMVFPHQNISREKHALDPDLHYELLSKETVQELGAPCPKHLSLSDYTTPCMLKATHGLFCYGTYMAKNEEEAQEALRELTEEMCCERPVVTEVIPEVTGNYCVQFYLHRNGDTHWVGVSRQIIGESLSWGGGVVDAREQQRLKDLLIKTVMPVKEYLYKKKFFGFVGMDILTNKDGQFVIDLNPRINGSTPLLMMSPVMAEKGFPVGVMLSNCRFPFDVKKLVSVVDELNSTGKALVVILGAENGEWGCEGYICVFAVDEMEAKEVHEKLVTEAH
ncbi:predicted protein [Nematostella vectensis]|uniref:ATP-grasp domain-containing protein n=1 Tax=Nematostella vectensis TaxID=45351 RepID=A7SLX8_NEMVE|nr:uncharacterized protein LOC5506672 [Nematostella vectensis]XP_032231000.1 uncharacterized protein LOC5506672 [Nematostella vectensis]EDO35262.1 predicted protein [Nematostella vectensis]|eukprot:XP_001627362.1 predicted protein [Nematostella vectensis]